MSIEERLVDIIRTIYAYDAFDEIETINHKLDCQSETIRVTRLRLNFQKSLIKNGK